jgi:hypothetical protein
MSGQIVLCMKWGTPFPAEAVNVLHRACRARTTLSFDFVCLTDDAAGLDAGIRALPIPDIGLTTAQVRAAGVWPKLALYVPDLQGLSGRCLFIDLDMVVLGSLDDFFTYPAPFVTIDVGRSWRPGGGAHRPEAGTGLVAFDLGRERQILDRFQADPEGAIRDFRNEQDFVAAHASSMAYWPPGWVISFKRFLRQPIGIDLLRAPRRPPPSARVVAFHGTPRPMDLVRGGFRHWDRWPHMGWGKVGWMADYWREMGGRL